MNQWVKLEGGYSRFERTCTRHELRLFKHRVASNQARWEGNMRIMFNIELSAEIREEDTERRSALLENVRLHAQELYTMGTMVSLRPVVVKLESVDDDEGTVIHDIFLNTLESTAEENDV